MTAEDFVDFVGARSVSQGMWVTQCPAHGGYRAGLVITKGYNGSAKVECLERCSINQILKSLGLTRHEFECWPAPRPNELDMDIDDLKAFRAGRRKRQALHAAACTRIRTLQDEVNRIKGESRTRFSDKVPMEWKGNLDEAELMLSTAKSLEVDLRDLDPSFQLWDAEESFTGSSKSPWAR